MTALPAPGPHGEVTCVAGRTFCLSGAGGQIRTGYDHGLYLEDTRVLSTLVLRLDGAEPHALGGYPRGSGAARFTSCVSRGDDADPTLLIERRRTVTESWHEHVRITNHGMVATDVLVEVDAAADFAYIFEVKHGRPPEPEQGEVTPHGLRFRHPGGDTEVELRADPPPASSHPGCLRWELTIAPRGSWEVELSLEASRALLPNVDHPSPLAPPAPGAAPGPAAVDGSSGVRRPAAGSLARPRISCSDARFERLVDRSVSDLDSLLVRDGDDRYFAAGSPWFLTLFGRDSLWAGTMALPLGVEVLGETLRLLAGTQGRRHDPVTEEAPGKILHEVRYGAQVDRGDLPPLYYGTIDATPLFVVATEQAWRWGLDPARIEALLPHVERALAWMRDDGDPDDTGFLRYSASGDRRLANQGWKDSGDAISFADGRLADAPIALCEVQGYAYRAAISGAALLDHFGRPGGAGWRDWAAELRERFHRDFWDVDDPEGLPALALDGAGRRVDAVTSNAGHLLATGILDADQARRIADRLAAPDLDSGWGLRTLSARSPRFNPLSYHGGSVWPHDTAIVIDGLVRVGAASAAAHLLRGLLAVGEHLGYRLPELFGGEQRTEGSRPLPYPSACRPQAWSAGAALYALQASFGLDPDVPNGVVHVRPPAPGPFARLTLDGMPLAGGRLSLDLDDGVVHVAEAPPDLEVVVHDPAGDRDAPSWVS